MSLNIQIENNIHADQIIGKVSETIRSQRLSNAAKNIMDPYVPFCTGNLSGGAYAEPGAVVYPASYATYPYHKNFNFKKPSGHSKATNYWDKASIGENCTGPEGEKFLNEAAALIKAEVG